jgi:hypothetical protein
MRQAIKNHDMPLLRKMVLAGCPQVSKRNMVWLHFAIFCHNIEAIKFMLDNGFDVNLRSDGVTPLYTAFIMKKYDIMELLLARGARADLANSSGITMLDYAAKDERTLNLIYQYRNTSIISDELSNVQTGKTEAGFVNTLSPSGNRILRMLRRSALFHPTKSRKNCDIDLPVRSIIAKVYIRALCVHHRDDPHELSQLWLNHVEELRPYLTDLEVFNRAGPGDGSGRNEMEHPAGQLAFLLLALYKFAHTKAGYKKCQLGVQPNFIYALFRDEYNCSAGTNYLIAVLEELAPQYLEFNYIRRCRIPRHIYISVGVENHRAAIETIRPITPILGVEGDIVERARHLAIKLRWPLPSHIWSCDDLEPNVFNDCRLQETKEERNFRVLIAYQRARESGPRLYRKSRGADKLNKYYIKRDLPEFDE